MRPSLTRALVFDVIHVPDGYVVIVRDDRDEDELWRTDVWPSADGAIADARGDLYWYETAEVLDVREVA
jgi:hypothetical protein